jgi:hypothetical protein
LTLSLKTFIIFLGYVIYNPVSVPQEESGQKRQKSVLGQKSQRRLYLQENPVTEKYPAINKFVIHIPNTKAHKFKKLIWLLKNKEGTFRKILFRNPFSPSITTKGSWMSLRKRQWNCMWPFVNFFPQLFNKNICPQIN